MTDPAEGPAAESTEGPAAESTEGPTGTGETGGTGGPEGTGGTGGTDPLIMKGLEKAIYNFQFSSLLPSIFPQKILFEMVTAASAVFNIITSQLTVSNVEMIKNIIMNELKSRLQRSESNPRTLERYDKFVEFLLKEIEKNPTLISSSFVSPIVNGVLEKQSGGGTTWFTSGDMLHNKL